MTRCSVCRVQDRPGDRLGPRWRGIARLTVRLLLPCLALLVPAAWAASLPPINRELAPGARLVFPYYDLRSGSQTFLLLTNVGDVPAGVTLDFYGQDCDRTSSRVSLSPNDIDLVDVGHILGSDRPGFQQGFVDAVTSQDVLLGTAMIVNVPQDWAVVFPAAPAQRLPGTSAPFRRFPFTVFLPALLTPGAPGSGAVVDGLLILTAPNPTDPGGSLPDQPIDASFVIHGRGGYQTNGNLVGHQVIVPIGELTQGLPPLTPAWIELQNRAVDAAGQPIGLVGLFIQTLVKGGGGGMGMATRLWRVWCHPLFSPSP